MEVNQSNFRRQLLPILQHIANASFVTFDLEMSGINIRPKHSSGDRSHDVGKPSLQQQYDEMRLAAETFQVLQVGITCVEEDREKEFYLARPFNFNLNPLSAEGVDLRLDRTFTFSTSACDFLKKNSFDFGKVFKEGVPYLSRDEEEERREEYAQRASKNAKIPDIVIAPDDVSTLEFSRSTRKTIAAWARKPEAEHDFVNIGNDAGPMNAFQRRIVHQIVRNEFPSLRVFARNDGSFMQVERLDQEREDNFQKRHAARLRWIFEALAGGDLSGIDPESLYDKSAEDSGEQLARVQVELASLISLIRTKRHILVGHNLFADLAFLFATFVGHLPVNVKHFQEDIHALFPHVIDTKFVATYGTDAMNPRVGLKDLLAPFRKTHVPLIVLHEKHNAYGAGFGKEHEAGFDSWMTAELFVKLAAQKYREAKALPDAAFSDSDSDSDTPGGGGATLLGSIGSDGHHPAEWHARQLNARRGNMYILLADEFDQKSGSGTGAPKHWLPSFNSKFWDLYMNKLRVNASEGGMCDLAEREDDERLDGLRRKGKKVGFVL
ncbi:CAF1 family ribonuclease [Diplocarpon rosae]|nr:CAF1 family ribonuclease [Diplocarpon rosae]